MVNKELAKIFSAIALYLSMDNVPFKPQAYERAATALETLSQDVQELYKKEGTKGLQEIPGIGKAIAEKIQEYIETNTIAEYKALQKKIPVDIEDLQLVEGIGPKSIKFLYEKLNIKTLKDLERAAKAKKLRSLSGFGEKTEQNILQAIAFLKQFAGKRLLGDIAPYAEEYCGKLKASGLVEHIAIAGSVRRMKETVQDIDIIATSSTPNAVMDYFVRMVPHEKVWGKGKTKTSLKNKYGFDIDLRVVPKESFGAALQYFTGSKEHNVQVRTLAGKKGYKLSEYGLFKGKKLFACKTEKEVYQALGMQYVEPELREDQGEIQAALDNSLPNLISYNALQGDLQVQTDWTDGAHSIEHMAKEAKKQGLSYIAITDHTKDLAMTRGLDEKKLQQQAGVIDKLNKTLSGITVLKGAEVNIRKDGSLDITNTALAQLDVVGVSVHSLFKMSQKDMTARLVKAIQNPHVDMLFHPTGRSLPQREAYDVNMPELIQEAKKTGTVLEINAQPRRLDLKDSHIRLAVEQGVSLVINSDAHSMQDFSLLRYGIAQARRGWAEDKDIVNTKSVQGFVAHLKKGKKKGKV